MQTTIVVLAAILLISFVGHLIQSANFHIVHNKLLHKEAALLRYRTDRDDPRAIYYVKTLDSGKYGVIRRTFPDGRAIETTIKIFDTDDAEYNYNGAVELVDMITEKLCYD